MSLAVLLASFDDDALAALANKGLLRRAQKAHAAGETQVIRFEETGAEVTASGQTVILKDTPPQNAKCDCSASGVCSHILMAVIALRDAKPATHTTAGEPPPLSAREILTKLPEAELRKFAGADYERAVVLAETVSLGTEGANAFAECKAPGAQVTFIAGQPVKAALYKGPGTRKRLVITAAAIAVRCAAGMAPTIAPVEVPAETGPEGDTLAEIGVTIEASIRQVFHGSAALASERFLDLAISARVQSAPRLTSQLMTLSALTDWADKGDIRFDGARFLSVLAETYALSRALTLRPNDLTLRGVARRGYEPGPAVGLWVLGASGWSTASRARGLTLHLLDPETGKFLSGVIARGAGQDPSFSPNRAFASSVWGAPSAESLTGSRLYFAHPSLSADGQLSTSSKAGVEVRGPIPAIDLAQSDHLIHSWESLRDSLHSRTGTGLARRASPLPSLITPSRIEEPWFDDMSQRYEWAALDAQGEVIHLSAPPGQSDHLATLTQHFPGAVALLITTSLTSDGAIHEPISILSRRDSGIEAINLHFTKAPTGKLLSKARAGLAKQMRRISGKSYSTLNANFAQQALTQIAEYCRHPEPDTLAQLAARAEAQHLILISDALQQVRKDNSADTILKASYLCGTAAAVNLV